jgi:phosphoserine aminotransferase
VTVVIARKDLIASGRTDIPVIFRYETHAKTQSLYNTPPTFAIYLMRNVLAYLDEVGMDVVERTNREKGALLYGALDELADFYTAPVEKESRSLMNVVFNCKTEELEKKFVAEATKAGMVGLAGHRSTGGIRASTYNAVSLDDVGALVDFMRKFRAQNG